MRCVTRPSSTIHSNRPGTPLLLPSIWYSRAPLFRGNSVAESAKLSTISGNVHALAAPVGQPLPPATRSSLSALPTLGRPFKGLASNGAAAPRPAHAAAPPPTTPPATPENSSSPQLNFFRHPSASSVPWLLASPTTPPTAPLLTPARIELTPASASGSAVAADSVTEPHDGRGRRRQSEARCGLIFTVGRLLGHL